MDRYTVTCAVHRRSGHLLKLARQSSSRPLIAHSGPGDLPPWAVRWAAEHRDARLITARVPQSRAMDGESLERAAGEAYDRLLHQLGEGSGWHPLRMWNYVPDIVGDGGDGLNRYMRFNAGRHRALVRWLGSADTFDKRLPAASAVGTHGDELIIHVLACQRQGTPVDNPRQRPPHHYSQRFGPRPPCFARGTLVEEPDLGPALLVGGTASVRGEDSVHAGDLASQLEETIENLAAVVRSVLPGGDDDALGCYRELRVYHVRERDEAMLRLVLPGRFPRVQTFEFVIADLCRPELLVEIEGFALPRAINHARS